MEVVVVDDRPGDVEPLAARGPRRPALPGQGAARLRPRSGRGPQRRLAGHDDARGWPSSTTTSSCPAAGAADWSPTWPRAPPTWRRPGAHPRAAARRPAAHRLGAVARPACGPRALDHRRHGLPPRGAVAVDGFDERFPRAYREDADLALRVQQAGWRLQVGARTTTASGPAGRRRGQRAGAARQRRRRPDAPAARAGLAATRQRPVAAGSAGTSPPWRPVSRPSADWPRPPRRRQAGERLAAVGAVTWLGLTADFARLRIAPGPPRTGAEVRRMLVTSAAIPVAAVWHRVAGSVAPPRPRSRGRRRARGAVRPRRHPRARRAVQRRPATWWSRSTGPRRRWTRCAATGSGSAWSPTSPASGAACSAAPQVEAVNARIDALLGPFDTWQVCPHAPEDRCACRKPRPGMVLRRGARASASTPASAR